MTRYYFILVLITFILNGCHDKKESQISDKLITDSLLLKVNESDTLKKFCLQDFFGKDKQLDTIVAGIFNKLNDEERVGQLLVTSAGMNGKSKESVAELIKSKKVGGVVFFGGNKIYFKEIIRYFNNTAKQYGCLPLIYSIDAEPSLINQKIYGLKKFPKTNTIKSPDSAINSALQISEILKDIGFKINFAPVCDISLNKEVINDRSFGNIADTIIRLASAFVNATQSDSVIATIKHFPGHGNVKGDSHKQLVYIDGELKELKTFKALIDSGVISVMVGHIAVKNNEKYGTDGKPASLSRKIVTDLLKNELGFKGIVITDAMNMFAVSKLEKPSLNALLAGCDIILMPSDESKLIKSVIDEMAKNNDFREQIYQSVKKVIRLKICAGII